MHCRYFRYRGCRVPRRLKRSSRCPPDQHKEAGCFRYLGYCLFKSWNTSGLDQHEESNSPPEPSETTPSKYPVIAVAIAGGDESYEMACHPSPSSFEAIQHSPEPGTNLVTVDEAMLLPVQSSLPRADSQSSSLAQSCPTTSETGRTDLDLKVNVNGDSIDDDNDEPMQFKPLRDLLCYARIEWPEGSFRYFIPMDEFDRIVKPESISVELTRCGVELASEEILKETAREISKAAPKLFAILVCLERGRHIIEFLDERIDDTHLPFVRSDKTAKSRHFKLCSKKSPDRPIKCMAAWDQAGVNDFGRDQWCMFAPIFEYEDDIKHYELDDNCVLPWVEDGERSDRAIEGGYGSVWKIAIHPAHQQVKGSAKQKLGSRFVALKRLHSSDEQSFRSEVEMLRLLQKREHAHVINLLATFQLKGRYYLLFPYADFNLRQYWQHTPMPAFSENTVSWILHQCKAIASALLMVHEYQGTQEFNHTYAIMQQSRSDTSQPQTEDEGRRYGRHGDIKAENILLFAEGVMDEHGRLVLADFGMTAFHKKASRSKVKPELVTGSPSYEPPELMLYSSISRAYDIWSLGCLYLEFITWLLCGWEQLKRFPDARGRTGVTTPELDDDTFFTILEDECKATVRQGVQDWMKDLHELPRCSAFIHEFLNLISEHMLIVNPGDRIPIGQLIFKLGDMLEKARNSHYLLAPIPSSPRDQEPEPFSLAALTQTGAFRPPRPTEGRPLPRRSSLVSDTQMASNCLPQTESQTFVDTSPPSSPRIDG